MNAHFVTPTLLAVFFASPALLGATLTVSKTGALTTIQAAIDQAVAGDDIVVEAGTYQENPRISAGKTGISITGKGTVIVEARGAGGVAHGAGIVVDAANVELSQLTIRNAAFAASSPDDQDGHGLLVRGNGFLGRKLTILGSRKIGIYSQADQALFQDCQVRGAVVGMYLESGTSLVVDGCTIRQCDEYGIEFTDVTDLEIFDCLILGIEDGSCIASDGGVNATVAIHDNRLENADADGLEAKATGLVVERNVLVGTGGGMFLSGDGLIARDNELFTLLGNEAIFVSNTVGGLIERNTVRGFTQEGIFLQGTTSGITVRNNSLRNGFATDRAAIRIDGVDHVIEGNKVTDVAGDAFLVECNTTTFTGNVVKRAVRDGFDLTNQAILVTLENNQVNDCGAEGLDHTGIFATIRNNTFKNCRIDVAAPGTLNEFTGNVFATGGQGTLPEID